MRKTFFLIITLLYSISLYSQYKQGNTVNAEIYADAPYRMKIIDDNGNLNPIPIHVFAHDADGAGANIELMSIDIYIKNASDANFTYLVTFDDYDINDFRNLFLHKSPQNDNLDVQDFESSDYQPSSEHTIVFKETHDWLDGEDYVEIERKFWYFTILLPPDKIAGFDSIIDVKVYFNIDWSVDDETNLRIFRYSNDVPRLKDWYRGDTHYHTIFTQNIAETGEALEATRYFGRLTGLDWQFTSDHSCDFDNYGVGMQENWNELGNQIYQLNALDTNYVMIRGVEMSINNNGGYIIHALTYPSEDDPFSMPYVGDGGGDSHETSVNTDMLLDSVMKYHGMVYAAHPFAEYDKLPDVIDGSVWNISDPDFVHNGESAPSVGTVICNDLSLPSDVYSDEPGKLFKDGLYGFQIWNLYNSLTTKDNDAFSDPYDATYTGDFSSISQLPLSDPYHHLYRLSQNFDVVKFLWEKGLQEKNANPSLQNWKTYIIAGSDAHGSFNYSTTNMYYAFYGTIEDNAIGRLNTLVYLPNGKGQNGTNIIKALKRGHQVLSDGPIIAFLIKSPFGTYTCGDDIAIDYNKLQDYTLELYSVTTPEYGDKNAIRLILGTEEGEFSYPIFNMSDTVEYNLYELLNNIFLGNIPQEEYFYLRFSLETYKDYGDLVYIYKKQDENFYSFTNPVWMKLTEYLENTEEASSNQFDVIYGNNFVDIQMPEGYNFVSLFDVAGKQINVPINKYDKNVRIYTNNLSRGIYMAKFVNKQSGYVSVEKIMVK
jgi:hypothetical protein